MNNMEEKRAKWTQGERQAKYSMQTRGISYPTLSGECDLELDVSSVHTSSGMEFNSDDELQLEYFSDSIKTFEDVEEVREDKEEEKCVENSEETFDR